MTAEQLTQLIHDSKHDWVLRSEATAAEAIVKMLDRFDQACTGYCERFPTASLQLNDATVFRQAIDNPHRIEALLQTLAFCTPLVAVMAWRIMYGDTIARISMIYRDSEMFKLSIAVKGYDDGREVEFEFDDIEDATVLQHIAIMRINNKPVFDGYYCTHGVITVSARQRANDTEEADCWAQLPVGRIRRWHYLFTVGGRTIDMVELKVYDPVARIKPLIAALNPPVTVVEAAWFARLFKLYGVTA